MLQYVIRRILLFIPTFFIVSVLLFVLSRVVPGDPVAASLSSASVDGSLSADRLASEEAYRQKAEDWGLDKPIFYFSISTQAYPDTLYRIYPEAQRRMLTELSARTGNWAAVASYYEVLKQFRSALFDLETKLQSSAQSTTFASLSGQVAQLLKQAEAAEMARFLGRLETEIQGAPFQKLHSDFQRLQTAYQALESQRRSWAHLLPNWAWHGWDNQYHNWMRAFLQGDWGLSYSTDKPVRAMLSERLYWTVLMNIVSLFFVVLLSIPLGVYSAVWRHEEQRFFPLLRWWPKQKQQPLSVLRFVLVQLLRLSALLLFLFVASALIWLLPLSLQLALLAAVLGYSLQRYFLPPFLKGKNHWKKQLSRWGWLLALLLLFTLPLLLSGALLGAALGMGITVRGQKASPALRLTRRGLYWKGGYLDSFFTSFIFLIYSLPSFWVATLLMIYTTSSAGLVDWFPTQGTSSSDLPADASWWLRFSDVSMHLVLPIFCLTYGGVALISRQMRRGMLDVIQDDYILTARAKGLSKQKVIWKHTYRNALMPILALSAGILPSMLAGSVAIELIFNIPGMGNLVIGAINQGDWPVVLAVLMLASILTIVGSLLADILTKRLNPRVKF